MWRAHISWITFILWQWFWRVLAHVLRVEVGLWGFICNKMFMIWIRNHRIQWDVTHALDTWAPSQYPKRRLSVRSRKVSKPRDLYSELSYRSEIWQALRQQCCRCACQISKRYGNLKYQSRGFETLRDLTKRRLFGYWDGALLTAHQSQSPKLLLWSVY